MKLDVRISNTTLVWAAFIVVSASFMRYMLNYFAGRMTMNGVEAVLWCIFSAGLAAAAALLYRARPGGVKAVMFILAFILGLYYASTMKIIEERWHIIQFGILGFMIAKDASNIKSGFYRMLFATACGFFAASLDEVFQFYLPNRTADIRDIVTGTLSSIWGSMLSIMYATMNIRKLNAQD